MAINWGKDLALLEQDMNALFGIITTVAPVIDTVATGGAAGTVDAVALGAAKAQAITQIATATIPSLTAAANSQEPGDVAITNALPGIVNAVLAVKAIVSAPAAAPAAAPQAQPKAE